MVNTALILCEGGDDVGFLNKFCKEYLKLNMNKLKIQKIGENNDKNGKSAFWEESTYQVIKQEVNYGQYSKVLFMVDADYSENDAKYGGLANTEKALTQIISTLEFTQKAKYFIACDPTNGTGNLEHLILSTIDDTKKECINELLNCVLEMEVHSDKKIVLSSYEAIFKESPYNYTHENFNKLRELILWVSS
jgi:hypothetical protein